MFTQPVRNRYFPVLLFLGSLLLYTSNIGGVSIYILDEAKNAGCAREMLESADWIVPTFNYELRTDKPPLHYFFMMLSYKLFGVNEWAARFFSAVFGALTVLVTFLYTRKHAGLSTALWTSAALLASVHLSIQFHLAVPDPYLIFFFTWSLFLFFDFIHNPRTGTLLLLYLSLGLGTLAKGPVAIALPGLIFLLYLIFTRRLHLRTIHQLKPLAGAALVLAVVLPWYLMVHRHTGGAWTEGFFLTHNLGRFAGEMEGHGGIFLITFAFVLIGMFPFSGYLVQAVRRAWTDRKQPLILFSLIGAATIVGFFSVSRTKLPNYTVPAYPFLAILIGHYLASADWTKMRGKAGMLAMLIVALLAVPGIYIGLQFDPALHQVRTVAFYFLPLPAGMMAAYYLSTRKKQVQALYTAAVTGIVTAVIFFCLAFPVIDRQNPVYQSISLLEGKEVRYLDRFNPAYAFYLKRPIERIAPEELETFFNEYPNGVVISAQRELESVQLPDDVEVVFSARDVFETPITQLLKRKQTND